LEPDAEQQTKLFTLSDVVPHGQHWRMERDTVWWRLKNESDKSKTVLRSSEVS